MRVAGPGPAWPQWAQNARHTGSLDVAGQGLKRQLADVVYDPLVPSEREQNDGELLVHYQVPLVDGDMVFMESKEGTYSKETFATQQWCETALRWVRGELTKEWDFMSDWKAPGSPTDIWEPVFHAALADGYVFVPAAGGTIVKLRARDGRLVARINPFDDESPRRFTVSPISVDPRGNVYFNVIELRDGGFYENDAVDSWLVKVSARGDVAKTSYAALTPGAPGATTSCATTFTASELPWPPAPDAAPAAAPCGKQRVGLNVAPAIAPDGTIYSVSRAHFNSAYGYLVAANPDLSPKWSASLRGRFHDGCGVPPRDGGTLPPNGAPGGCRMGAPYGVDPATNSAGGGRVSDSSSSSPTIAPDGRVLYGASTRYNYSQGHLMQFSAGGEYLGAYGFGWDITPAIYDHGSGYSIVIKDNRYGVGSYCTVAEFCPAERTATNPDSPEAYYLTQLSRDLAVEWRYQNTNKQSCTRGPSGEVTCVEDHPASFEWCVNAPAVDSDGVIYANSEDGWLYAVHQGGRLKGRIFQQLALGAAYTPTSLGGDGKIYSQNAGHLFVVGDVHD